jgi:putative ABC transport system permease protein
MLGVIFGVIALIAMLSIGEGAKREALRQIEQLGINNVVIKALPRTPAQEFKARERLSAGLTLDDAARIKAALPSIAEVAAIKEIEAEVLGAPAEASYQVTAVTPGYQRVKNLDISAGRFLCDQDQARRKAVCVLGWGVSRELGPPGRVGSALRIGDTIFMVVGVLELRHWTQPKLPALSSRNYNRSIFIPFSSALIFGGPQSAAAPAYEISVRFKEPGGIIPGSRVIKNILSRLHHGVEDYQMIVPLELIREARQTQGIFNIVLGGIAGITLLVGGIGIMNIMLATVSERTREIGIRRAVGANRRQIAAQFLTEAAILTVTGGLIGVVAGCLLSFLISGLTGWSTVVTGWAIILALAMALLVGIFSGFYPATRAARLDPIQALRHE